MTRSILAAAVVVTLNTASPIAAQLSPVGSPLWVSTGAARGSVGRDDGWHIEEGVITGIGAVTAALVAPGDRRVRAWATSPSAQGIPGLRKLGDLISPMGNQIPLMAAAGTWIAGKATGRDELAAGGLIAAESIAGSMAVKGLLQRVLGRRRPNDEPHDPWSFSLGRGFSDRAYRSFPSGHAANAFALAAAVNEELHHIGSPANPWVSGVLYGAASVTSFSRVMADEHWLSDIVAGAVLGGVTAAVIADANGR